MPGKGAIRRGKARLQRGQCKTLAALFFAVRVVLKNNLSQFALDS
jgi:hypothetical protein